MLLENTNVPSELRVIKHIPKHDTREFSNPEQFPIFFLFMPLTFPSGEKDQMK